MSLVKHVTPDATRSLYSIRKMDIEKVEKLIEIVRGHTFLYDLGHQQYKNASLKLAIWDSIGRDLNESGETVRNKWKTVRDGYTKYKKQLKSSTVSGKKNVSYTWASQLAFLDNFNAPRESSSNVQLPPAQLSLTPRAETLAIDSSTQPSTSSLSQVRPPSQVLPFESKVNRSTSSRPSISCRKNKRPPINRRNADDVGRVLRFLNAKKRREYDVIDNLFLSYADTFKKFPPREQAIIKLELAKLFSNIELQLLDDDSNYSHPQFAPNISPAYSSMSPVESRVHHSPKPQPTNPSGENNNNVAVDISGQSFEEQCIPKQENLPQFDDYDMIQ